MGEMLRLCTIVVHYTEQSSSDNLLSDPLDNHHSLFIMDYGGQRK